MTEVEKLAAWLGTAVALLDSSMPSVTLNEAQKFIWFNNRTRIRQEMEASGVQWSPNG